MQQIIVLFLVVLTFCLGAAFSFHNPQAVQLNYLIGQAEFALGALLMSVIAATVAFMVLIYWILGLPRKAELARLRRQLQKAESELANLRKLPLKDG
jgi:uncharacterized membrane protein YciS (DUF1049 family)